MPFELNLSIVCLQKQAVTAGDVPDPPRTPTPPENGGTPTQHLVTASTSEIDAAIVMAKSSSLNTAAA